MGRVSPSAIMELIKTAAAGNYISFASGLPDPDLYPVETLRGLADEVLTRDGRAALQYGAAEGYAPLREFVAEMLRGWGLPATADHVLITNGSQQGLDLAARALLDPGDRVIVESPSYLAALQVFDSYEARYLPVPIDENGIDVTAVRERLADCPKLLYTLPNFQNPTGATLAGERRQALAEAAANARVAVVEDDAYHDLRLEGETLPPVCALAENPWAIYTGTLSKTVAPGIRVGYVWAQPELIARLAQLKQVTDLHTGSLTQRIAYEYCVRGHLEPGIQRLRDAYRARRNILLAELATHLTGKLHWTHPQGGMFLWATLPPERDAGEFLARAMEAGVVFVPGTSFYPGGAAATEGARQTLRLNFVSAPERKIREGVAILSRVLQEWS